MFSTFAAKVRFSGFKPSFSTVHSKSISTSSLKYAQFGNVDSVLSLHNENINKDNKNSVVIKFLASPINPADINIIQGVYGRPPTATQFPAVAGMEGVAVVEESSDSSLSAGDWVIPATSTFGTWRTHAVCSPTDVIKISKEIPATTASLLSVSASTAYRVLEDFVSLKKGDVIIQNAANSTVGQSVIQLAKEKGVKTINVVRHRDAKDFTSLQQFLKGLGADEVVAENAIQSRSFKDLLKKSVPKLAINSTGGQIATDIARSLPEGGTFVTIGGMSRLPVVFPTSLLLFKDITLQGFWINRWIEEHSKEERLDMLNKLIALVKQGKLKFAVEEFPFAQYTQALARSSAERKDKKVVLKF